jgi:cellulose synthase/poly-beta-1,6-N-acetylglucosamine synthase-like glycosyltransferase/chitodextrinase
MSSAGPDGTDADSSIWAKKPAAGAASQAAGLDKLFGLAQETGPQPQADLNRPGEAFPAPARLQARHSTADPLQARHSTADPLQARHSAADRRGAAEPLQARNGRPAPAPLDWTSAAPPGPAPARLATGLLEYRPGPAQGPGPLAAPLARPPAAPARQARPARQAAARGEGKDSRRPRRQWGHDRRKRAPLMVPQPVSDRRLAMGRLAIIITVTAWVAYFVWWLLADLLSRRYSGSVARAEAITYLLIVTLLTASSLAYLLSRLGFFYRTRSHHRASRAILDRFYDTADLSLTTIIPSYQEETGVIRKTLLSAALQEFPVKRIVLLIDDPPVPRTAHARELLAAARALPAQLQELLSGPATRFGRAYGAFEAACQRGEQPSLAMMADLAAHYDAAVAWLDGLAASQEIIDHTDAFFANELIGPLAAALREIAAALHDSIGADTVLRQSQLRRLYRRLAWTFRAEFSSFERKQYVSLSHEPNKAMNLNSYLGLMGGAYRVMRTVTGPALVSADPEVADLVVPSPDYVVTLDADSMLLPEYCLRLVHLLEQQEHSDIAIAQTPYSAFPGSATRLERIAGATTDLQHIVHQGLTYYDATFWVGANAVIRKPALDDIAESSYLGDWEIKQYIRDRTVIEDTESTIDMGSRGWRLFNYPERMSYSATPPDFGSLCIQRRRWANGGLLILPKLRRQSRARRSRGERTRFGELFLRWNYMASICWSSFSLLILLAFPFSATLISPLLGLVALPYFLAMASDLRYCGYKRIDVARIYGFNLILLPVNLSGTVSSLVQGITASKAPFARTPKVRNRTVAPPFFVIAPYLMLALSGATFYFAYRHRQAENMGYAGLNIVLTFYAIVAFIGIRNSVVDGWVHLMGLLRTPARQRKPRRKRGQAAEPAPPDWRAVLDVGSETGQWSAIPAGRPPAPPGGPAAPAGPGGPGAPGAPAGPGGPGPQAAPPVTEEPRARLSPLRVLVALILVAGLGYGGYVGVKARITALVAGTRSTWFAPYVDVTLLPTYQFQSTSANPSRQTVLGFVVADPGAPCTPSWGAAYTMAGASQSLALASRIAQLRQNGTEPIVSFGGRSNTSLDVACTSVAGLALAYQSVIDEYHLTAIDLDIEGAALDNFAAEKRRAAAIAALEQSARNNHRQLRVWLTLPVEPSGLQGNALSVISAMLRARVQITGINVMAMDFSQPPGPGSTMLTQVTSALNATHAQLASLFPRYGLHLLPQQIWQRMGATVMIGQNDVRGERFTIADAQGLAAFADHNHLGRVSEWSLNRDMQCGSSFPETGLMSNVCSGTAQGPLGFTRVFSKLGGVESATAQNGNVLPPQADTNPADAPYPQWSATASYPMGYKVVENGEIFQAKWFNSGQDPAAQVQYSWQTPWELLGPVLPGDHAPTLKVTPGAYPQWAIGTQYTAGDRVTYHGLPYEAKWGNQGVSPAGQAADPAGSPWRPLFRIPGEPTSPGG